jgi:hypothetical protein
MDDLKEEINGHGDNCGFSLKERYDKKRSGVKLGYNS